MSTPSSGQDEQLEAENLEQRDQGEERQVGQDGRDSDDQESDDGRDSHKDEPSTSASCATLRPTGTYSLVEYYGPNKSHCGYCKSDESGRRSYDMETYRLTSADYQELLDRGWRRSGSYCYRVNNPESCCPNYSIVCRATEFQVTRSHRKCIAKVLSFLATGDAKSKAAVRLDHARERSHEESWCKKRKRAKGLDELRQSSKLRDRRYLKSIESKVARCHEMNHEEAAETIRQKWEERMGPELPLENYLFPTAAMLDPSLRDTFAPKHKMSFDMVYVDSARCTGTRDDQQKMLVRYQAAVHREEAREWTMHRFCNFLVDSPIITEPLTDFGYLARSQEGTDDGTLSVPVNSSPDHIFFEPPQLPTSYGSYHCNYYLDGKLIATGVMDVLPKCITTVYFFYDPHYAFLNLGIFSALVEISMIRRMARHYTGSSANLQLTDYYLGMYVHECKKMHYKTRFEPSYLLCSKTFRYVPTPRCLQKLLDRKYADFAEAHAHAKETSKQMTVRLLQIPIESPLDPGDSQVMSFLRRIDATLGSEYVDLFINGYLSKYADLIGPELSPRIKLKVNVVYESLKARCERLARTASSLSGAE